MKRLVLQIIIILSSVGSFAAGTADLLVDPAAKELLGKKCIRLGTSEILSVPFDTACVVLEQSHLLEAVQEEFIRSISQNGEVDFPVVETSPGVFYYINEKGKRSDIIELYRKQTDEYSYDYIVLASGKRFFGGFDVIIHLQVIDAGPSGIVYSVSTHAYPRNMVTRFSARNLGPVKNYFKKKMKLISYVAREVALGLCEKESFQLESQALSRPIPATAGRHGDRPST
ncbi:MAG: hypothetical protein V3V05_04275 [Pontiella sp.]